MPQGSEDFTLNESNSIFCAHGSKIIRLMPDGHWKTVVDLAPLNLYDLSRISIKNNSLALINLNKK